MGFWLFWICFINVLFKVITNFKFDKRCLSGFKILYRECDSTAHKIHRFSPKLSLWLPSREGLPYYPAFPHWGDSHHNVVNPNHPPEKKIKNGFMWRGEVACTITTAKPLDAAMAKEVEGALAGFLKKGEKVLITYKVRYSLLRYSVGLSCLLGSSFAEK